MTSRLNSDLLSDTLNVVQLARQAAMARGSQDRAGKLSSVANELHKVVSEAGQTKGENAATTANAQAGDTAFRSLLSAIQHTQTTAETDADETNSQTAGNIPSAIQERNLLVTAMAAGTMSEVDIARQLGITRDEVRAILSLNRANTPQKFSTGEVNHD